MQTNEIYAGGLSLHFFPSMDFEPSNPNQAATPEDLLPQLRNLLRLLMGGWRDDWHTILNHRLYKAVLIKRDHVLTQAMRLAFQQGFEHVFTQLANQTLDPLQQNQAQLFISNCLCYLPFADISPYESIAIPQCINDQWIMVDYKVTPIELTPKSGLKKLFISDYDRVFAYGLEPINQFNAEPHLVFMGTTYPAGQGFSSTIETDLEAFETAGKKLYRSGHRAISDWLNRQPKKPHVCGTSLGGALSLLVAIDQGHKITRVDALNPPGLYQPLRKSRYDHWDELPQEDKPTVVIQKQSRDPVSRFGKWKDDWDIVQVTPPEDKKGPNSVTAHALNYAGLAGTTFLGVDTAADNAERKTRNLWLYTILRSTAYYLLIAPYRYALLPATRFMMSKKGVYTLAAGLLTITSFIFFPPLMTIIVAGALSLPILGYAGYKLPQGLRTLLGFNKPTLSRAQNPTLPRNESLDLYAETNAIEAEFTYRELGEYYRAQRCTLKDKPFLPEESPDENFKNSGLSKRQILERSEDETHADEQVTLTATKAKIHDMRKIIHIVHEIGFHAEDQHRLRAELASSRTDYLAGKVTTPALP